MLHLGERRGEDQTPDRAYRWTFLFLGANQDAIATAAQLNVAAANSATYVADDAGSRASHTAFSRKARALRRSAMGIASAAESYDATAAMSDLVQEEDRKERRE